MIKIINQDISFNLCIPNLHSLTDVSTHGFKYKQITMTML